MRVIMSSDTTERVYRFIVDYIAAHDGLSPSQREIAEGCYIAVLLCYVIWIG